MQINKLGFDLAEMAEKMAKSPPAGWPRDAETWQRLRNAGGQTSPLSVAEPVSGFDVDRFSRDNMERLWNRRDFSVLESSYAQDFQFDGATDRKFNGSAEYVGMLESLYKAFPDIQLQVDEVYWMGNEADGFLTSERWSATGTHTGNGNYGAPSEIEAQIWGITQHHIIDGKVVREWMLFNELDLMMQIAAAR